jgi:hypothetical protein
VHQAAGERQINEKELAFDSQKKQKITRIHYPQVHGSRGLPVAAMVIGSSMASTAGTILGRR